MLIQFSVRNFLSFKDEATLSMVASKRKSKDKALDLGAVHALGDDLGVLKAAVIYGANNSGKSNLIKALRFCRRFILDSSRESTSSDPIRVTPFLLNPETEHAASDFEITFARNGFVYQYEMSVTRERVERERLSRRALKKHAGEIELFMRDLGGIKVNRTFKEGKGLEARTRQNALFLSVCANFDGEVAREVQAWFSSLGIVSGLLDAAALAWTAEHLDHPDYSTRIPALLRAFDLGVERFERGAEIPGIRVSEIELTDETGAVIAESPEKNAFASLLDMINRPRHRVATVHKMFTSEGEFVKEVIFDLAGNESEGTKKLVAMAGPIIDTLTKSSVLVIDEFESSLHTNLSKVIIGIFNSQEGNPRGAQLVAATHDTNLLSADLLRRDQIWFTGRDGLGGSSLTSLVEYKVRNDASYEKSYLGGDYGGTPFLRPELARDATREAPPVPAKAKVAKRRSS